jgi:hypothetical protein
MHLLEILKQMYLLSTKSFLLDGLNGPKCVGGIYQMKYIYF